MLNDAGTPQTVIAVLCNNLIEFDLWKERWYGIDWYSLTQAAFAIDNTRFIYFCNADQMRGWLLDGYIVVGLLTKYDEMIEMAKSRIYQKKGNKK